MGDGWGTHALGCEGLSGPGWTWWRRIGVLGQVQASTAGAHEGRGYLVQAQWECRSCMVCAQGTGRARGLVGCQSAPLRA